MAGACLLASGLRGLRERAVVPRVPLGIGVAQVGRDELTVVYVTGNGLKTQELVADSVHLLSINPTMKEFEEALHGLSVAGR